MTAVVVATSVAAALLIGSSAAEAASVRTTFDTAGTSTFVVPFGVTSLRVTVAGAQGGYTVYGSSGWGGVVDATIPVTPGESLQINVGGHPDLTYGGGTPGNGVPGFNGGGAGGPHGGSLDGGGGGGASDIRRGGTALTDRVVVAGGGGGGGGIFVPAADNRGGDGGASTPGGAAAGLGGQATTTAGGAAGTGGDGTAAAGVLGQGGAGGTSSGGGGGGYYGGGGGEGYSGSGLAGGGGSSYAEPTATSVVMTPGANQGTGKVTISYVAGSGRALDTRGATRLQPGTIRAVDLAASGVPDDALAVEVNLTVDSPHDAGYLSAFACGATVPLSSNLNFAAAQTISNSAIVPIGTDGDICITTTTATDLIVDVLRYFDTTTDRLTGVVPTRLYDSRLARASVVPAGSVTEIAATGLPSGATSAVVHLTATQSAGAGYLTAYACGTATPDWSNLNTELGRDVANRATVDLPGSGRICVFNSTATHLIVDLDAAYTGTAGAGIDADAPVRIHDSRAGARPTAGSVTQLAVGVAGTTAVALNVTVDSADLPGYLTVWPCDQPKPATSNGNYAAGVATATALTISASAAGTVCASTSTDAHLVVDLQARFAPVA